MLDITPLDIPSVKLIRPKRLEDSRGFFAETYNRQRFVDAGIDCEFVQDNQSYSSKSGTVRGLHYQEPPHAQAKLVRVLSGSAVDVAVDVRIGSPTYGQYVSAELSAATGLQIFVPAGFLHGFVTLEPDTHVAYKVDAHYNADAEGAVIWNDETLAIDWGVDPDSVVLSEKDAAAQRFVDFNSPF